MRKGMRGRGSGRAQRRMRARGPCVRCSLGHRRSAQVVHSAENACVKRSAHVRGSGQRAQARTHTQRAHGACVLNPKPTSTKTGSSESVKPERQQSPAGEHMPCHAQQVVRGRALQAHAPWVLACASQAQAMQACVRSSPSKHGPCP